MLPVEMERVLNLNNRYLREVIKICLLFKLKMKVYLQ